jgi:TolB-like protein/Tfp pilus assembly protein PilF
MKHCPECNRNYADPTLSFCLQDGAPLIFGSAADEPRTAILSGDSTSEAATRTFEPTPTARPSDEPTQSNRRSVAIGIAVLLLSALGIGGYLYYGRNSPKQIDSIAVMPFVNESGNAELEYLSDGMTETLINALMQLPNLNVQARSSVFRYKGKEVGVRAIGRELNVQAILNGRVVQRSDGLTLYLELVDAVAGTRIWGEQYDRKQSDLVSLQREVARDVASKLQAKLSSADQQKLAKNYTSNPEAYELYLRGNSYWEKRGQKNIEIAIGYYQQAIEKDPNYALAYAGLAQAYAQPAQQPQGLPKAREAAQKALSLDNNLAEAHSIYGRLLAVHDYDLSGAEREYLRAIELNPNYAAAHSRYASLLTSLGKFDAAEAEHRRALELEPLSLVFNTTYGEMLVAARRYDDAIIQLKKTVDLDDKFFLTYFSLATVYQLKGNYSESVEMRARRAEINGNAEKAASIRESFAKGGWEGYLRYEISLINPRPDREERFRGVRYDLATMYAQLGEKDKAFEALNDAYENREFGLLGIKVDPRLDPLRDDPRFSELLKKVGFPE